MGRFAFLRLTPAQLQRCPFTANPLLIFADLPQLLWALLKHTHLCNEGWRAEGSVDAQRTEMQKPTLMLGSIIGNHNTPPSGILTPQNG